jgi:hypothetical protein
MLAVMIDPRQRIEEVGFPVIVSAHGVTQTQRRGIPLEVVRLITAYGRAERRTGIEFRFIGHREVAAAPDGVRQILAQWEHTVVLLGEADQVITAYRNRRALRDIRRKEKYRAGKEWWRARRRTARVTLDSWVS